MIDLKENIKTEHCPECNSRIVAGRCARCESSEITLPVFDSDEMLLSWIGGFFDGEGTVALMANLEWKKVRRYRPRVSLTVSACQTEPISVNLIKARFGGTIQPYQPKIKNGTGHIPKKSYRYSWKWFCHAAEAHDFCRVMVNYTVVKKKQMELAMAYYELPWRLESQHSLGRRPRSHEQVLSDLNFAIRMSELNGQVGEKANRLKDQYIDFISLQGSLFRGAP